MNTCMDKCNADSTCTGFSWALGNEAAIPADDSTAENGYCYFRSASGVSGDIAPASGTRRDFAARILAVPSSSSSARPSSSFTSSAAASTATLAAPTTAWSPNVQCSAGGTDPAGGRYTDRFGALWEVRCQNQLDVVSSEDTGTTGQGIYGCWKGCNNRPGCSSFVFDGTVGTSGNRMCLPRHWSAAIGADNPRSGHDHWVW